MLCPSLKYGGIVFQNELPKTIFMRQTFGMGFFRAAYG